MNGEDCPSERTVFFVLLVWLANWCMTLTDLLPHKAWQSFEHTYYYVAEPGNIHYGQ